ncbi:MAG: cytidine deaminase [Flavobacteriales bacterium]|nr:cytidine deaminase [Flavobacteriales bacterium]
MADERQITFRYTEYDSLDELDDASVALLQEAEKAMGRAYAPYSHFHVGAAVRLESGKVYTGNNQENVAYPSGLCAERVALFHAMSQDPKSIIEAVAITARSEDFELTRVITPCGACRQALLEYEVNAASPIQVILGSTAGRTIVVDSVLSMLPLSFCETKLKKG